MAEYLSTDPNAGMPAKAPKYLSTDPHAGKEKFETQAEETLSSTLPERISANPIVRALTSAAEPVMGAAALMEKPFGGTANADRLKQLKGMQSRGSRALGFSDAAGVAADVAGSVVSPLSVGALKAPAAATAMGRIGQGSGFGAVSGATSNPESPLTEGTKGALFGAGASGVAEGAGKLASRIMTPKLEAPQRSSGAGAEKAVNELQRQRELLEAGKAGPTSGAASPVEDALMKSQGATGQFRDVLNKTTGKFDPSAAVNHIDTLLSGPVVNTGERAVLERVKKEIGTAIENANKTSKSAGQSSYPGFVLKNGKLVKDTEVKGGTDIPIEYVDSLRKSINEAIHSKDAAGKPLGADTQRLLYDVQNVLLKDAPDAYKKSIAGIAEARAGVDAHKAEGSVRSAVTGDMERFKDWTRQDKQNMMHDVFEAKRPGEALKQAVRDTAHNPEAAQGVREAYTDWLTVPTGKTDLPTQTQLFNKWRDTREAVKESGLMTPEHIAVMDKVMDDVADAAGKTGAAKAWASTGGFLLGMQAGHPTLAAHLARDLLGGGTTAQSVEKAVSKGVTQLLADPATANLLAQPPTQATVNAVMQKLQPLLSAGIVSDTRAKPKRDPLSMQPRF